MTTTHNGEKLMAARYPGKCYQCSGKIAVGEQIAYSPVCKAATHLRCATYCPEGAAAAAAYAAKGGKIIQNNTCSYRGCSAPATMSASRGGACSRHYDALSD